MSKHYPPVFGEARFHCALCGVYAKQNFVPLPLSLSTTAYSGIWRSYCDHCKRNSFWEQLTENTGRLLIPSIVGTPPAAAYMPNDVLADYNEAAAIYSLSPRGSAALLRLAVQKLMVHLGKPGVNINDDIKSLVADNLPVMIQQALDYCRVVGNNAVHPGEILLNDTPEMAWTMFEMINLIVTLRIAQPKELENLYGKLPEGARRAIEKRDAKPQVPTPPDAP